jgi:hypothetical protein
MYQWQAVSLTVKCRHHNATSPFCYMYIWSGIWSGQNAYAFCLHRPIAAAWIQYSNHSLVNLHNSKCIVYSETTLKSIDNYSVYSQLFTVSSYAFWLVHREWEHYLSKIYYCSKFAKSCSALKALSQKDVQRRSHLNDTDLEWHNVYCFVAP